MSDTEQVYTEPRERFLIRLNREGEGRQWVALRAKVQLTSTDAIRESFTTN